MDGRGTRTLVSIATLIPLVMTAVYVSSIRAQGSGAPDWLTVPFVATYMVAAAAVLAVSLLARPNPAARTALRAGGAGGLLVLGYLGGFSIGVPLILAGVLAALAAVTTLGQVHGLAVLAAPAAALIAVSLLVGGFEVTERVIACPPTGTMSGGGTGLVSGPYEWNCADGTLHWRSG